MFNLFKKDPYIGEVYMYIEKHGSWMVLMPYYFNSLLSNKFYKFRKSDVTDEVGTKIKIFNKWVDKSCVFYYNDIYNSFREKIVIDKEPTRKIKKKKK